MYHRRWCEACASHRHRDCPGQTCDCKELDHQPDPALAVLMYDDTKAKIKARENLRAAARC